MQTERRLWLKTREKVTTIQRTEPERENLKQRNQISKISLTSSEVMTKAVLKEIL